MQLVKQTVSYGLTQTVLRTRELGWRLRGARTIEVGGVRSTFLLKSLLESRGLRFLADHESAVLADVLADLGPDDVFFDIGANIGFYTCFAAAQASVVAFEPAPPNVGRIRDNLRQNGRAADIHEVALADEPGTATINRAALTPGYPFATFAPETANGETFEVEVDTGDRLIERGVVPQPTVVKIDVEGAEPLVIEGMRSALTDNDCRRVYCEVHREATHDTREQSVADFGGSEAAIAATLSDLGFEVDVILDRGNEIYLKGKR